MRLSCDHRPKAVLADNAAKCLLMSVDESMFQCPCDMCTQKMSDELVELLTDTALSVNQNRGMGIYLLSQRPKYLVPKVKVFIDFLVENLMGKHD